MIEKPKRPKKIPNQDNKQPQTIEQLIRRYDLDNTKIYDFLDDLVGNLNENQTVVSATEPTGNNRGKVWIQRGKNLFNKEEHIAKRYYVSEGDMEIKLDSTGQSVVCLIPCEPNQTYSISYDFACNPDVTIFRTCYIETTSILDTTVYKLSTTLNVAHTLKTSENAKYIVVQVNYAYIENVKDSLLVEQSSTATEYEEYIESKIYVKNDNDIYEEFISKENLVNYSTGEQRIGTWIDGKTLYRRVFETGALPNAAIISSATDLSVTNTIVRVECYAKNDSVFVPLSYASRNGSDNVSFNVSINSDTNCYQLTFGTASDKRTWTGYVIIEYTKATD